MTERSHQESMLLKSPKNKEIAGKLSSEEIALYSGLSLEQVQALEKENDDFERYYSLSSSIREYKFMYF